MTIARAHSARRRSPRVLLVLAASTIALALVAVGGARLPTAPAQAISASAIPSGQIPASGGLAVQLGSSAPSPSGAAATTAAGTGRPEATGGPDGTGRPDGGTLPAGDAPPPSTAPSNGAAPSCPEPPPSVTTAPVVYHGSRRAKVVALTFDDGYGATTTRNILAILERARVNATFFPVGRAIERETATWKQIAAAGFPIGDHTYDHRDLVGLCYTVQLADITRQQAVVISLLGVDPLPVFRPPYGLLDRVTRAAAAAAGERDVVMWDVDARDWAGLGPGAIAANALAGGDGSIVIMHTMVPNTALALPRIIAGYRARGFQFVTIGQLLGIGGAVPFP